MDKLRGLVARRANEIENLATKGWLDKPNAEFLFREITNKAREIQAALLASLPAAAGPTSGARVTEASAKEKS